MYQLKINVEIYTYLRTVMTNQVDLLINIVLIKNLKRVFSTKSNTTNTTTSPSIKKPVPRSNT